MKTFLSITRAFALMLSLVTSVAMMAPSTTYAGGTTQSAVQAQNRPGFRRVAANDQHPEDFGLYIHERGGNGVLVQEVDRIGAAQRVGLRVGDIVTSMNGRRLATVNDFTNANRLAGASASGDMQMVINRAGRNLLLRFNIRTIESLRGYVR